MTGDHSKYLENYLGRAGLRLEERDGEWMVAGSDSIGADQIQELEFLTGRKIRTSAFVKEPEVDIDRPAYSPALESTGGNSKANCEPGTTGPRIKKLLEGATTGIVDSLLENAAEMGASDIHIEPFRDLVRVRFRLDGILQPVGNSTLTNRDAIFSRLKIMAGLDIAEKRRPQDGRIAIETGGRKIDMRVSTLPTRFGEKVVLRLLDREQILLDMSRLGLGADELDAIRKSLAMPHGMILVTGPTGSGKTTTLYASLQEVDHDHSNVMTIEDPIEYELKGINQAQVKSDIGFTFAKALRAFLRQDPDIIMVGEIRDGETAEIAIRSALTGHLVFSTVHTNDAPSTITRLVDMGLQPFLVASSLRMVIAQRLVRRICVDCRIEATIDQAIQTELELHSPSIWEGRGCSTCNGTGYRGRVALFEMMPMTEQLSEATAKRSDTSVLRKLAIDAGMKTLRDAGCAFIEQGITTPSEVLRATSLS